METKFDYFSEVVEILIDEESKSLGERFIINEEKLQIIKDLCRAVSELEDEIKFDEFNAGFNDANGNLEFKIVTGFFTIKNNNSGYYTLLKNALKFKIVTVKKEETVGLCFTFSGVWDYEE